VDAPVHLQQAVQVVVVQAVGGEAVGAANQLHRLVRLDSLGVEERVEEFAAQFHARDRAAIGAGDCFARDDCVADELHFRAIRIADGPARRCHREFAARIERADLRLVDLQRVGVRVVAALGAVDFRFQLAGRVERLHRKLLHRIVGVVAGRPLHLGRAQHRRVAREPVSAQRQHAHQDDRQVNRERLPRAAHEVRESGCRQAGGHRCAVAQA
jgi:hypothetical protein